MKKFQVLFLAYTLIVWGITVGVAYAELISIDDFKGLNAQTQDKIKNNEHSLFNDVYIDDGNIKAVKGRDKVNTTAHSDKTVNGIYLYEVPEPDGGVAFSDLLFHCDGADASTSFIDVSDTGPHSLSANGNIQVDTAQSKFGGASCLFDGTGDYISSPDSADYTLSSTPFTFDFWVRFNSLSSNAGLIGQYQSNDFNWVLTWETSNTVRFKVRNSGADTINNTWSWTPVVNTWYHFALTRNGNPFTIYIDGTSLGNVGSPTGIADYTGNLTIGQAQDESTTVNLDGWIDEFRARIGTSNYGTDVPFTPRTTAYAVADASVQKIVLAESTNIATYDFDGSDRTVIASGLNDSDWDFTQVGEALYMTNFASGQYKWLGTSTASKKSSAPKASYIEEYKGVLFTAEDRNLRFSDAVGEDETDDELWSASNHILVGSDQHVATGLQKTSDSLLIFTDGSIQELTGFGAASFQLKNISDAIGTVSNETLEVDTNGDIIFFAGTPGVYKLQVGGQFTDTGGDTLIRRTDTTFRKISSPNMDNIFEGKAVEGIDLDLADYPASHAYYDTELDLYKLYVGDDLFIWDNRHESWTHVPATSMLAAHYLLSVIDLEPHRVMVDNVGFFYEDWEGFEAGVESGTVSGNPTSSTSTTLVDSGATFDTTDDGLAGVWVYIDNDEQEYRQIQSNTSTTLTVSPAWTTNPIASDDYYIGYIIPRWRTKQFTLTPPPTVTELTDFWIIHNKSTSTQTLNILAYEDKKTLANRVEEIDLSQDLIDRIGVSLRSPWIQFEFETFIYNTSDSIGSPLDISAYAMEFDVEKPE